MIKHHLRMVAVLLLGSGLAACGGGGGTIPGVVSTLGSSAPTLGTSAARSMTDASKAAGTSIAIDAGGGAAAGNWIADADYSNVGWTGASTVTTAISTSRVLNPAPQSVYQTQRFGANPSYAVPNFTPNGAYNVRLHFAETFFKAAKQRVFNVKINGVQVLTNFDVYQSAGGANNAIVEEFATKADASGKITIQLGATVNYASIAGIEISGASGTPAPTPTPTPKSTPTPGPGLSIDVGGGATSNWVADTGFIGGSTTTVSNTINTTHVANPAPQSVYQSQRYAANLTYTVPRFTPDGAYVVRLHFVESFFSGAGQRVFGVKINNSQVLTGFDILQDAGGPNIATAKQFATRASASGTITIELLATVNNASLAGIEIVGGVGSPTPTPSPRISPSPSPSPTATSTASGGAWPAAGWMPYTSGPLTVPVGPNPTFTAGSSSIINAMWAGRSSDPGRIQIYSGPPPPDSNDYSQPLYFGRSSDPQYRVTCYDYGGNCPASGVTVHIPRGAQPAGGTDHHIAIRDLATGNDVMLWLAPIPNGNGGSYSVGWGTVIPSNGNGLNAVGGSASGLSSLWALRETDLVHNTVNHAIIVQINGESSGGYVYPAVGWDNGYFHSDPWPKVGAHLWLDVAPPYASGCPQYAVSYLTALNKFGAYFADNGGVSTPMEANFESDVEYTFNGGASVWGPLMQSMGGNRVGTSNVLMDNCGINMQTHMHILNPPPVG